METLTAICAGDTAGEASNNDANKSELMDQLIRILHTLPSPPMTRRSGAYR